ncbi:MAG: aspartate aminotransferase family protein, partial [Candidatus Hydrogenedentes bacterium]|nr:aspartate aminotransferase family protein [Candidatus Hydrogenedentota bacterium]
ERGTFKQVVAAMTRLGDGLGEIAQEAGIPVYQTQAGSMGCLFFHEGPVRNYADATASDTDRFAKYFHAMLDRGVYLAPSQFEAGFTSTAHTPEIIDRTLEAARESFALL